MPGYTGTKDEGIRVNPRTRVKILLALCALVILGIFSRGVYSYYIEEVSRPLWELVFGGLSCFGFFLNFLIAAFAFATVEKENWPFYNRERISHMKSALIFVFGGFFVSSFFFIHHFWLHIGAAWVYFAFFVVWDRTAHEELQKTENNLGAANEEKEKAIDKRIVVSNVYNWIDCPFAISFSIVIAMLLPLSIFKPWGICSQMIEFAGLITLFFHMVVNLIIFVHQYSRMAFGVDLYDRFRCLGFLKLS